VALSRGFGGKGGRGWREDRGLRIEGDVVLAVFGPCHHILEREFVRSGFVQADEANITTFPRCFCERCCSMDGSHIK